MDKPDPVKAKPDAVSPEYLFSKARNTFEDIETMALFCVLYVTGARIKEVLQLRRKDVILNNIDNHKIMVFHCINLKNKKDKIKAIPVKRGGIDVGYYDIIYAYIKDMDMDDILFPLSPSGNLDSSATIARQRLSTIEIETTATYGQEFINPYTFNLHPHFLRHCRSSHWRMYWSLSETTTARLLGHTSTAMLFTYDRINEVEVIREMGVLK